MDAEEIKNIGWNKKKRFDLYRLPICLYLRIRMLIKASIGFSCLMARGKCERFTDFASKFTRRIVGGFTRRIVGGFTRLQLGVYPPPVGRVYPLF